MTVPPSTPVSGVLGRLLWMMFGPMLAMIVTFAIANQGSGWLTGLDAIFFIALGAMLFGRWLEFRGGNPRTADGQPATPRHLYRYLVFVGVGGVAVWVAANLIGNHWLNA